MPLSKYDRYYGGKKGGASKAHAAMIEQYGAKKGEQVFYALKNKRAGKQKPSPRRHLYEKAMSRGRHG
jgi:hypothetical protein